LVTYDAIIGNGRWFDGTGAPSAVRNIGIRGGHVVAISQHDLDETVSAVFVGGRAVFLDGKATDLVGKRRTGRFLRAAHKAQAVTMLGEGELASVS
jgi:N-acyl-D-aspartate/D-glutamate deacylase